MWPHFGIQITKLYKSTPHDCFNLTRTWAQAEGVAQVREGAGGKYSVQAMAAWQLLMPGIFPGELSQVCQYWGIGAAPAACCLMIAVWLTEIRDAPDAQSKTKRSRHLHKLWRPIAGSPD